MQSQRISSEVYSRRNLNKSIFIVVSFIVLWHSTLYSCNQTSSFEMSQPCYFSQARRKICWQQQQQKREPTTRVSWWTLFQFLAFACLRQAGFTKPTVHTPHNTKVEADNKNPIASSMKYRAAFLQCQQHSSFKKHNCFVAISICLQWLCTADWLPHKLIQPTINQFLLLHGNEQLLPLLLYFQAAIQSKCWLAWKHFQKCNRTTGQPLPSLVPTILQPVITTTMLPLLPHTIEKYYWSLSMDPTLAFKTWQGTSLNHSKKCMWIV